MCCAEAEIAEQSAAAHDAHAENGGAEIKVVPDEGAASHPKHEVAATSSNEESTEVSSANSRQH